MMVSKDFQECFGSFEAKGSQASQTQIEKMKCCLALKVISRTIVAIQLGSVNPCCGRNDI